MKMLTNLRKAWQESKRKQAFEQWQYARRVHAEMSEEYKAMFGENPVLERHCTARIDREKITVEVENVTKDSTDGSLTARVIILSNNSAPHSHEATAYQEGRTYMMDAGRLTKIKDADPDDMPKCESEDTYALREYAAKNGIQIKY